MMDITISSSISEKPRERVCLPLGIRSSIRSLFRALGENVENILAAAAARFGVVLHAALSPIGGIGHGVFGNPAEEANFGVGLSGLFHALDQDFQALRVAFG